MMTAWIHNELFEITSASTFGKPSYFEVCTYKSAEA